MAILILWTFGIPIEIVLFTTGAIMLVRAFSQPRESLPLAPPASETGGLGKNISPRVSLLVGLAVIIAFFILSAVLGTNLGIIGFWLGALVMIPWLLDALRRAIRLQRTSRLGVSATILTPALLYIYFTFLGPEFDFGPVAEEYFIQLGIPLFAPIAFILLLTGLIILFSLFGRDSQTV